MHMKLFRFSRKEFLHIESSYVLYEIERVVSYEYIPFPGFAG